MAFLKYLNFIWLTTSKKISIYLTIFLYFGFLILVVYLLPYVLSKQVTEVFASRQIISILVLILVIVTTTITIQIFLIGKDNGLDLLIISKPITKISMLMAKWLTTVLLFLIISCLACVLVSFSALGSQKYWNHITSSLCISVFLGTFIGCFVWSSLTILFASFMTKYTTFLSVIGFQVILVALCLILNFVPNTTNKYFVRNQIQTNPIGLISNNDNQFSYNYYVYATEKENPLRLLETQPGIEESESFLSQSLKKAESISANNVLNAIDIQNQFVCMFRYYDNQAIESMNLANKLVRYTNKKVNFVDWRFVFGNKNKEILDNKNNVGFDNYLLSLNNGVQLFDVSKHYKNLNFISNQQKGYLDKSLFDKVVDFPVFNMNNGNWETKQFANIKEFASYYFSSNQINNANKFVNKLSTKVIHKYKRDVNTNSYYFSLLMTYLYTKNKITNIQDIPLMTKLLKQYSKLSFQFQYWTYLSLKEIDKLNYQVPEETLKTMYSILNVNTSYAQKMISKFAIILDDAKDFNSSLPNVFPISNSLSLFKKDDLQTLSIVKTKIEYNYLSLYLGWSIAAIVLSITGMIIFIRKDIY